MLHLKCFLYTGPFVVCNFYSLRIFYTNLHNVGIPYSAKFSRRIIFAFFADWSGTAKFMLREFFFLSVKHNRISSKRENCFRESFQLRDPRKLCASKIWRYTVLIVFLQKWCMYQGAALQCMEVGKF